MALVLANGLFAGAEIAVLSIRRSRVAELVTNATRGAKAVDALRRQPERFLATVQVGITVVGATAAAFAGESIAVEIAALLREVGLTRGADQLALALVVLGVSFLSLILGELVPKSLALRYAEGYALRIAGLVLFLSRLAHPIVWLLTASSNAVLRIFGDETTFTETRLSPDELKGLIEEAGQGGDLDAGASDIAARALELRDLTLGEVLVPRQKIVALRAEATPDEIRTTLSKISFARLPVYAGDTENITGYVRVRDLYARLLEAPEVDLSRMLHPIPFFPRTLPVYDALRALQRERRPMAIVLGPLGGVDGLVTVEDLVEELVGEIRNEGEQTQTLWWPEADGAWLVSGLAPLRDVNRALGISLDEGSAATVGGYVVEQLGELPEAGASFTTKDGCFVEVVETTPRRVVKVRLRRATTASREEETSAPDERRG